MAGTDYAKRSHSSSDASSSASTSPLVDIYPPEVNQGIPALRLGIHPGQARATALLPFASELPAALLARMLGIHIDGATTWQRISAGDWMAYAADVSRRDQNNGQYKPVCHGNRQPEKDPFAAGDGGRPYRAASGARAASGPALRVVLLSENPSSAITGLMKRAAGVTKPQLPGCDREQPQNITTMLVELADELNRREYASKAEEPKRRRRDRGDGTIAWDKGKPHGP